MSTTTALPNPRDLSGAPVTPGAASRPDPWLEAPAPPLEFQIRSAAEAEVLCRLLGLLAQLQLVPQRLQLERRGDDLHLALRVSGLSLHRAGLLAEKLRGLVCVWQVAWRLAAEPD